jgi:hypothetical protein
MDRAELRQQVRAVLASLSIDYVNKQSESLASVSLGF